MLRRPCGWQTSQYSTVSETSKKLSMQLMNKDRRKYRRHWLADDKILAMDQATGKVAMINNISHTGMQLTYRPQGDNGRLWRKVNLFCAETGRVLVLNLECQPVYDIASLMEDGSFSGSVVRACGVQFNKPTKDLADILDNLADGDAACKTSGQGTGQGDHQLRF